VERPNSRLRSFARLNSRQTFRTPPLRARQKTVRVYSCEFGRPDTRLDHTFLQSRYSRVCARSQLCSPFLSATLIASESQGASVYPACTWLSLFDLFARFWLFGESATYASLTSLLVRSPPPLPSIFLMDGHLTKTRGGKKGQIRPMIRFCVFFSAARVTTGRVNIYISSNSVSGRQIEVDSSVATSAFVGTNPTDGPSIRPESGATLSGALESRTDQRKDFIRHGGRPWDRAAPRGARADSWREWPRRREQWRRAKSSAGRKA
jgi:hypothetical protein